MSCLVVCNLPNTTPNITQLTLNIYYLLATLNFYISTPQLLLFMTIQLAHLKPAQLSSSAMTSMSGDDLPIELWANIISHVLSPSPDPCHHYSSKWTAHCSLQDVLSLCLVSKRCCAVARPLLVKHLTLTDRNGLRVMDLFRAAPYLQGACKRLDIAVKAGPLSYNWHSFAHPVARAVSGHVRCLQLRHASPTAVREPQSWQLIQQLTNSAPNLEHLRLYEGAWVVVAVRMINRLKLAHLQTLDLDFDDAYERHFDPHQHGLSVRKRRTAALRSITVRNLLHHVRFVTEILAWPNALEEFSLTTHKRHGLFDGFPALVSALASHAASLSSVSICHIGNMHEHYIFNATAFPRLKTLEFSRWQMRSPLQFTLGDAALLGPAVTKIIWNFEGLETRGDGELAWKHFGEQEEEWLLRLVEVATAKQAALREVHILYTPILSASSATAILEDYPWDRMNRVRDKMGTSMSLSYNTPNFSRDGRMLGPTLLRRTYRTGSTMWWSKVRQEDSALEGVL